MNVEQPGPPARELAGSRLRSYLLDRLAAVTGERPSIVGLEKRTGVKRQQMHVWFAGTVEPQMGSLQQLADGLGVSRASIVAAMDGETEPEPLPAPAWAEALQNAVDGIAARWTTHEAPPWAEGLTDQIVSAIGEGRQAAVRAAIDAAVDVAERRLFGDSDAEAETPPTDPPPSPEAGQPGPEA